MPQSTICSTYILQTVMGQNFRKIVAYDMRPVMSKCLVPELRTYPIKERKVEKGRAKRDKRCKLNDHPSKRFLYLCKNKLTVGALFAYTTVSCSLYLLFSVYRLEMVANRKQNQKNSIEKAAIFCIESLNPLNISTIFRTKPYRLPREKCMSIDVDTTV